MAENNINPLGYVDLNNGSKAIYPMNDIFLNYTFENASNWETLRLLINIFVDLYIQLNPETSIKPITGKIEVRTQFQHLLNLNKNITRNQDIKIDEDKENMTYVEFQNKAKTKPPIEIRSVDYFALGLVK